MYNLYNIIYNTIYKLNIIDNFYYRYLQYIIYRLYILETLIYKFLISIRFAL